MMVCRFAGNISVPTTRQIDMLHNALFGEQVEKAEDRCASNAKSPLPCVCNQVGSGKVPAPLTDQGG
jgi:hypothetical protein